MKAMKIMTEKTEELGGVIDPAGMCWVWAHEFTEKNAKEFEKWLDENRVDYRGPYDNADDTFSVRFR